MTVNYVVMLGINLLPQEEKRIIRMIEARRAVMLFTWYFFLVAAVGIVLLLPSYFFSFLLRRELGRSLVVKQNAVGRGTVVEIFADAKKIKDAAGEVRTFLASPAAGAQIMEKFSTPGEGIAVTALFIHADGGIVIEGRAATRDRLLSFEETLRASGLFLGVSFPLADLVRERDIRFSAHAKLKTLGAL